MASTSAADWLAAIGTGVGALVTVGTLIVALRQINTERQARQRLERQAEQQNRRAQAERLSAWPALRAPGSVSEEPVDEEVGSTWIAILNRSEEPVYWAIVSLVLVQGAGPRTGKETPPGYRETLSIIPPGKHYASVAPFLPGMNARPGVELAFTDRAGVHWVRSANGALTEIDTVPIDYYELGLPQGWSLPISDEG
jgi:hypothetical protein